MKKLTITIMELKTTLEIGLLGSFSNGDLTDESNIDLLVELEKPIGLKFFHWKFFLKVSL